MKKFVFLYILTILPYSLNAMSMFRTSSRFEVQKCLYSTNSPKSLGTLSFYELKKLAQNKEFAYKEFKSALARYEDITTVPTPQQSSDIKNVWKNILCQFPIQNWNSMLLAREENTVLRTIHPYLPDYVKTTGKEVDERINNTHMRAKQFHNARPLDESLQQYYQEKLQAAGYSKIQTIYQWDNNESGIATSIYPYAYVTSDFFNLSLDEQLGILAHEDQHAKNFHSHKGASIRSFLDERNTPNTYLQFTEKEADLKAGAHGITIAAGLLNYFKCSAKKEKLENSCSIGNIRLEKTHPSSSERVDYIQNLVNKLEQEQKGYTWNPFHKIVGLPEWFKRC